MIKHIIATLLLASCSKNNLHNSKTNHDLQSWKGDIALIYPISYESLIEKLTPVGNEKDPFNDIRDVSISELFKRSGLEKISDVTVNYDPSNQLVYVVGSKQAHTSISEKLNIKGMNYETVEKEILIPNQELIKILDKSEK
jgi:hypothetical protein